MWCQHFHIFVHYILFPPMSLWHALLNFQLHGLWSQHVMTKELPNFYPMLGFPQRQQSPSWQQHPWFDFNNCKTLFRKQVKRLALDSHAALPNTSTRVGSSQPWFRSMECLLWDRAASPAHSPTPSSPCSCASAARPAGTVPAAAAAVFRRRCRGSRWALPWRAAAAPAA